MANTVNRAWAKPDPTAPPDIPYWFGYLADSVDAALPDSGWVNLTSSAVAASGFVISEVLGRLLNGFVDIRVQVSNVSAITLSASGDSTNTPVCTLPAAYRPTAAGGASRPLAAGSTGQMLAWIVTTAGEVQYVSGPPNMTVAAGNQLTCGGVFSK